MKLVVVIFDSALVQFIDRHLNVMGSETMAAGTTGSERERVKTVELVPLLRR